MKTAFEAAQWPLVTTDSCSLGAAARILSPIECSGRSDGKLSYGYPVPKSWLNPTRARLSRCRMLRIISLVLLKGFVSRHDHEDSIVLWN